MELRKSIPIFTYLKGFCQEETLLYIILLRVFLVNILDARVSVLCPAMLL
jgi:hypothetical protein